MRRLLLLGMIVPTLASAQSCPTPNSTSIVCNQTTVSLTVPVAAGTVMFNCTVSPVGWVGSVALAGTAPKGLYTIVNQSGVTFQVALATAATVAQTTTPGTLNATP